MHSPSINFFFKQHLLLNHWSKFIIILQRFPFMPSTKMAQMVQLCLSKRTPVRTKIEKSLTYLQPFAQIQNNFTEMFLIMSIGSTKIVQMSKMAACVKDGKELLNGQIKISSCQNLLRLYLKIIQHKWSLDYPLSRLFKLYQSIEKHGCLGARPVFPINP